MTSPTSLSELSGQTILYVKAEAYTNETHPDRTRAQFTIKIGYAPPDHDYMRGYKELFRDFKDRSEFEAALLEAISLDTMHLDYHRTGDHKVFGPNGLTLDPLETRQYSTDFYGQLLDDMAGL